MYKILRKKEFTKVNGLTTLFTMVRSKSVPKQNPANGVKPEKRKYKSRAGVKALRQIRRLQNHGDCLSSKTGIEQLVRSMPEMEGLQLASNVVEALREASEAYITDLFRRSMFVQINRGSKTLTVDDMRATMDVLKGVGPN